MAVATAAPSDVPALIKEHGDVTIEDLDSSTYHDAPSEWPYAKGFQIDTEQREEIELPINGSIPAYVAGTLYRTAPSAYKIDTATGKEFKLDHWFDGFTTVHRFKMEVKESDTSSLRITYNSRRTVDELMEKIRKTGRLDDFTFANKRDPCESFFRKAMTAFKTPRMNAKGKSSVNVGVTLSANMPGIQPVPNASSHSTKIDSLITKSDNSYYQRLDPDTLEPLGICTMATLHPELKGPLAAAHAKTDPVTGDVFNFNLEFGASACYRVFQASPSTGRVEILAKFGGPLVYIHSLFLTPSTVIVCLWNSRFTMQGVSMLLNRNILDSLAMDKTQPAQWMVIDRTPARRGVIATYTSDPLFCFHTINAYEEPSKENPEGMDIICDMAAYDDMSVIHSVYYNVLIPERPPKDNYRWHNPTASPYFARFRLPAVPLSLSARSNPTSCRASCIIKASRDISPELPTINPRYNTLKHRFVYGARLGLGSLSSFIDSILKYDIETGESLIWSEKGQTPGEAIFIADPEGTAEDDGVLLSVVLDGFQDRSYLLCLDARTLKEVGRAEVPLIIAHGFHGLHIPETHTHIYNGGD